MRISIVVASLLVVGCSSSTSPSSPDAASDTATTAPDTHVADTTTAVDSAVVDSTPLVDSGRPEAAPIDCGPASETGPGPDPVSSLCEAALPSTFACAPSETKTGSTACTDAMLEELVSGCFGSTATSTKCSAAQTKYPACTTCALNTWLYGGAFIDSGACIRKIDPASKCATAWRCNVDCLDEVCGGCDPTTGSGAGGTGSEMNDCRKKAQFAGSTTASKGACYDVASKDSAACKEDCRFAYCFPENNAGLINFYRGACRDGGDWTLAGVAKP